MDCFTKRCHHRLVLLRVFLLRLSCCHARQYLFSNCEFLSHVLVHLGLDFHFSRFLLLVLVGQLSKMLLLLVVDIDEFLADRCLLRMPDRVIHVR